MSLWFWELDRGGPVSRALDRTAEPDFLFPQMSEPQWARKGWSPRFVDYFYVSFGELPRSHETSYCRSL